METVYVKVFDETLYLASIDDAEATMTPEEWLALDLTKRYQIVGGVVQEILPPPPPPPPPPPELEAWEEAFVSFSQKGILPQRRFEALWQAVLTGNNTPVVTLENLKNAP